MGAGKTTLGKKIARKRGMNFIDLDQYIEEKERSKISAMFRKKGEEYFRIVESENLKLLGGLKNTVISTGGGVPCFYDNMDWMNSNGLTVYLKMEPSALLQRLKASKTDRPLLKNKSKKEKLEFIKEKLKEREEFYNKAKIVVDAKDLKPDELLSVIESH